MSVETAMEVPETSGTIVDPEIKGHAEKEIYAEKPTSSESISTTSSRIPNVDDEELLTGATTATIGLDDDDKDNPRPIVPVAAAVVQQWYQSLTAEERSGAVTFCDGAFLSAFLALATPWSLHQPQPEARRRRDVGT